VEPPPERLVRSVFLGPHGVRSGWRIALYAALVYAFTLLLATLGAALGVGMAGGPGFAVLLAAALLAGWVLLVWVDRRPPGALGFPLDRAAIGHSLAGTGIGGALLGAAVLLLAVMGMAGWVADEGTTREYVAVLASTFAFFAVAAAMEEALFRGYAFQALVQGIGAGPAVLASSALFALAHGSNPNVTPLGIANIFLAGVMLAVAYLRTRSLWFATGVHLGWNWTMATLLDFPVSGFVSDTPLYSAVSAGPELWTGGAFGPEAGIPATLAIAGGTAWLWRTRRLGESGAMRARRPLVDDRLAGESS
jgi:uncharacterized protein